MAERIRDHRHGEMIQYIGEGDSTKRRPLEEVLATEEEDAEDLVSLID